MILFFIFLKIIIYFYDIIDFFKNIYFLIYFNLFLVNIMVFKKKKESIFFDGETGRRRKKLIKKIIKN